MGNGKLCFTCYDDVTFQAHGYIPNDYNREIKRYTDAIYDGLTVRCSLCDRTVGYSLTESGKYRMEVTKMTDVKLTQDEFQAIKERAEKATAGPWFGDGGILRTVFGHNEISDYSCGINYENNAEFIANARQDIPKLVAEVERLQAQEHFAEYAIRQNKALWEALSKACESLGADTLDYYEEEGGI